MDRPCGASARAGIDPTSTGSSPKQQNRFLTPFLPLFCPPFLPLFPSPASKGWTPAAAKLTIWSSSITRHAHCDFQAACKMPPTGQRHTRRQIVWLAGAVLWWLTIHGSIHLSVGAGTQLNAISLAACVFLGIFAARGSTSWITIALSILVTGTLGWLVAVVQFGLVVPAPLLQLYLAALVLWAPRRLGRCREVFGPLEWPFIGVCLAIISLACFGQAVGKRDLAPDLSKVVLEGVDWCLLILAISTLCFQTARNALRCCRFDGQAAE